MSRRGWRFGVDRGGTFTDIVARDPQGDVHARKLLSEHPERYDDAAVFGIRALLGIEDDAPIPGELIEEVRIGTTVATNALLERKGEPTVLVTTRGFADVLRIGYQNRPKLFARHIELPTMLYRGVIEVDERIEASGNIRQSLDEGAAASALQAAFDKGIRACAIVLMHGYRYRVHEQRLKSLALEVGFEQVSVSHEVSPLIKYVARGDTTVVDAYLSPVLRRYVSTLARKLPGVPLRFMQSSGGLTAGDQFHGKDAILSGPAGGVVGAVRAGLAAGFAHIIGFDMGGTSTDVSHYAGRFERALDTEVGGVRLRIPMLKVHTVAAGGGSIVHFDGQRLRAGPESAGADPGPACYGRGGPLTVTDCNVLLGRLHAAQFPAVFGPCGDQPLDAVAASRGFEALAKQVHSATGTNLQPTDIAAGALRIAVDNMANAIKKISVQRGYDVTRYTLCCFGGAAGQHAMLVADELGMQTVFVHPLAGVLSAYGIECAEISALRQLAVGQPLTGSVLNALSDAVDDLAARVHADVAAQCPRDTAITVHEEAALKYAGTDTTLAVPLMDGEAMQLAFEHEHERTYGFLPDDTAVVIESITVEATSTAAMPATAAPMQSRHGDLKAVSSREVFFDGHWCATPVYNEAMLFQGDAIQGPAIISGPHSTLVVEPGWRVDVGTGGVLVAQRYLPRQNQNDTGTAVDPVMLEIFNNLFMSVADQMGGVLASTATSVNIKERLDFSCALFDDQGRLIANAPHVPVHLGSMGESVREIIRRRGPGIRAGQVYALNAPYAGGTHLPDVTVIQPVFIDNDDRAPTFFVAARGHHADIGGVTPGSMPAHSSHIDDEGVLIDNFLLVEDSRLQLQALRTLLSGGRHPVRNFAQNVADLNAQIASCRRGGQELQRMVRDYGLPVVQAYMQHVRNNATHSIAKVLSNLQSGQCEIDMDCGARICVKVIVDQHARRATIDFSGTSAMLANNFNAPRAVTQAAVLYVFRTLVDDDIPLNEGCLEPLDIIVPEGSLLSPTYPAAVVAGNVETSQVITDCLFGALQVLAGSQGTMNNLTFGDGTHQYYETLCGGAGAGPGFDGASAVHTHMTNSRLTDPEVLESRLPVLLKRFGIRHGSGGDGQYLGGDGVVREIEFLAPMTVSVLANNRVHRPRGLDGGSDGKAGANHVREADGAATVMPGCFSRALARGTSLCIETPGGGGCGAPKAKGDGGIIF